MKNSKIINININSIIVWKQNPRHEEADNEKEAIKYLFQTVGTVEMNNLAKDIGENGLAPYDLPIVVEDLNLKNKYYAYEGNRRMAVIKSIIDPKLVSFDKNLFSKYNELHNKYGENINKKVMVVLTDHDSAIDEIEKIHSGEQKGIGRKKWGSIEKDIFYATFRDKSSIALNITNAIQESLNKDITKIIKPTNIKRIFSNKDIRKLLNTKEYDNLSENDISIIDKLIDKAVEIENEYGKGMSRIFNNQDRVSEVFIPEIESIRNCSLNKNFNIRATNIKIQEKDVYSSDLLNILILDAENNDIDYDEELLELKYFNPKGEYVQEIDTSIIGLWKVEIKYNDTSIKRNVDIIPIKTPKLKLKENIVKINLYETYSLVDNIAFAKNSFGEDATKNVIIKNVGENNAKLEKGIFLDTNEKGMYSIKYELKDNNSPQISKVLIINVIDNKKKLEAKHNDKNHVLSLSSMHNTSVNICDSVNILINQLSELEVDKYNYVIATSLRALIELTMDEIISRKNIGITYNKSENKLLTRVTAVIEKMKQNVNISLICNKSQNKLSFHTVNNFFKTLDIDELLNILNISAHKSLEQTMTDKMIEVSNKQISFILLIAHYYLQV